MLDCPCSSLPLPLWPMVASADGDGRRGALRGCFRVRGVKGKKRAGERGSKAPLTWLAGSTARRLGANAFSSTRSTALLASGSLSCGAAESVWSVGVCEAPPSNSAFLSCFLLALVPGPAPCALALEPSWRPARQQVRAAPTDREGRGSRKKQQARPSLRLAPLEPFPPFTSPRLPPPAPPAPPLPPRTKKRARTGRGGEGAAVTVCPLREGLGRLVMGTLTLSHAVPAFPSSESARARKFEFDQSPNPLSRCRGVGGGCMWHDGTAAAQRNPGRKIRRR